MSANRRRIHYRRRIFIVALCSLVAALAARVIVEQAPALLDFEASAADQLAAITPGETLSGARHSLAADGTTLRRDAVSYGALGGPYTHIVAHPEGEGILSAYPPGPIDVAIILDQLQFYDTSRISIAHPLTWQNADPVEIAPLESGIDEFSHSAIGLDMALAPTPGEMPPALEQSTLPLPETGDWSLLQSVNSLAHPEAHLGSSDTLIGFTSLGAKTQAYPVIARWDERIVFSLALLTLVQAVDADFADISLERGKLRVGTALTIELDAYGRAIAPRGGEMPAPASVFTAVDLVAPIEKTPEYNTESLFATVSNASQQFPAQFDELVASTALAMASQDVPISPWPQTLLILVPLALLLGLTQLVPQPWSFAVLGGLALLGVLACAAVLASGSSWLPLTAILAAVLTALFFPTAPRSKSAPATAPDAPVAPTEARPRPARRAAKGQRPRKK